MTGLSRSSYYYKTKEKPHLEVKANCDLIDMIERIVLEFAGYGYRRVTRQLHREGVIVNHKKVLKLMRESSLLVVYKRKWIKTTDSNHRFRIYPNLANGMVLTAINQLWRSDITYIRIMYGFVYLAVVLDAFSRKVIGYNISLYLDAELAIGALEMAIDRRRPSAGVVHHSDRGVQYACDDYVKILKEKEFVISMSNKGNPYDNAQAESFMKTIKAEEVYMWDYKTIDDVLERVPFFIEEVYNKKRLHSSIGYIPPVEFEALQDQANSL
ncbi:MAG TPA: IS3 family transposase [Candidatus Goldiibacteriota bacterium]|nr:IS3 family transposase [Candidatus Goldiibacteriota bacterium]HRQ44030.1 IS3 family transposase [Candidatus Goldiibacteriota bacterium]